ncbi:MAG: YraN family protein [Rubrivivax sp.]|nr:YraN family protein [Rubrivivax sp.]
MPRAGGPAPSNTSASHRARKSAGDAAETRALQWLTARGLVPVARNYRVARGPSARGGEIDLVLRERDGTLVFVEVRARADARHGGAAASVSVAKQRRIVFAARHFLLRLATPPPCRFDVVAVDGDEVQWVRAAFDATFDAGAY